VLPLMNVVQMLLASEVQPKLPAAAAPFGSVEQPAVPPPLSLRKTT